MPPYRRKGSPPRYTNSPGGSLSHIYRGSARQTLLGVFRLPRRGAKPLSQLTLSLGNVGLRRFSHLWTPIGRRSPKCLL